MDFLSRRKITVPSFDRVGAREGFWTKPRHNPDLWYTLPVGVTLALIHGGWYTVALLGLIASGALVALGLMRKPANSLSILPRL